MFRQTEDAVQAALVRASGLPAASVIWAYQNIDAPLGPYLSLAFGSSITRGIDYLKESYDASRPAGQEFKIETRGTREIALEIQAFVHPRASDPSAAVTGETSARALLENTKMGLILPSVQTLFHSVGVSPFDPGPVGFVPDIVSIGFRGRSTLMIRCYAPAPFVAEYAGYISSVRGTITALGAAQPTGATFPFVATGLG